MATFEIPTRNDIFIYTFQVELETVVYLFLIKYNKRMDRWIMSIPNVVYDIPLIGGGDLLKQFHYLVGVPPGIMQMVDLDGLGRDAQEVTFSDRIVLAYQESA